MWFKELLSSPRCVLRHYSLATPPFNSAPLPGSYYSASLLLILAKFFFRSLSNLLNSAPFWFVHVKQYLLLTTCCDKYWVNFLSYPFASTIYVCACPHPRTPNKDISSLCLAQYSAFAILNESILWLFLLSSAITSSPGVNGRLLYHVVL